MNEMHEKEGKQDLTSEKKNNLGRKSLGQEIQRERKVSGEVKSPKQSREIEKNIVLRYIYIYI